MVWTKLELNKNQAQTFIIIIIKAQITLEFSLYKFLVNKHNIKHPPAQLNSAQYIYNPRPNHQNPVEQTLLEKMSEEEDFG